MAGILLFGFYLLFLRAPVAVARLDARPVPVGTPASPTPTDTAAPSPAARSPLPGPPPTNTGPAGNPVSTCLPEVITGLKATAEPDSVLVSWTVSGGCNNESGDLQGSFIPNGNLGAGYPGLWVVQIQRPSRTYLDHPHKPANSQGVCLFALSYWIDFNGTAPDGRGVPAINTTVYNVNLC